MVKGFPVVLSDRGAPFVAVEKNAPLATVAENGRGLPIRLVEKGAPPLVIQGYNVWSPLDLFDDGTDGALWEPWDISTLFQDQAGTTPVTAGGDPVRLVLDKSRGLTLGPELYTGQNASSVDNSAGGAVPTWDDSTRTLAITSAGSNIVYPRITYTPGITAGKFYKVYGRIVSDGVALSAVRLSSSGSSYNIPYNPTTGVFEAQMASGSGWIQFVVNGTSTGTIRIAELSIREIATVPLSQSVLANAFTAVRMPLTGRRNMLTNARGFNTTPWVAGTAVTSRVKSELGFDNEPNAATLVTVNASSAAAQNIGASFSCTPGAQYTFSFYAKKGTLVGPYLAIFDETNASFILQDVPYSPGDGAFVRVTQTFTAPSGCTSVSLRPLRGTSGGTAGTIILDAPQLEPGSVATPYQTVTNAYDVTEEGVPDVWSIVSDYAGDVLSATLPFAIDGEILIAGTGGTIIEPVSYASGSTFNLGTDTYTGGTPGILRAIGPIVGVVLLDRAFTEDEKAKLIDYYKGKGAKGLLVEGPELVVNGTFDTGIDGWTAINDAVISWDSSGKLSFQRPNAATDRASTTISLSSGRVYKAMASVNSGSATARLLVGTTAGGQETASFNQPNSTTAETWSGVFVATATGSYLNLAYTTNATRLWDNISVRELRPQEDW